MWKIAVGGRWKAKDGGVPSGSRAIYLVGERKNPRPGLPLEYRERGKTVGTRPTVAALQRGSVGSGLAVVGVVLLMVAGVGGCASSNGNVKTLRQGYDALQAKQFSAAMD